MKQIIFYTNTIHNSSYNVKIDEGSCVNISYEVDMPNNFERGIDELNDGWTCYDDSIVKIPHFKATLREMYQFTETSTPFSIDKPLEQELKIHTKCIYYRRSCTPENI